MTYGYDPATGRLGSLSWAAGGETGTAGYAYEPKSDLLKTVTSGGLVTEYGYETHRNLKTQVRNTWAPPPANETVLSQYDYRYDELGRRESVENSGAAFAETRHNIYTYNDRNELTGSVRKEGTVAAPAATVDAEGRLYEYDPIGNRINSAGGTDPQVTYARNAVNQYTALTGGVSASPAYDDDGNMTGYDGATYTWNAENRLIAAETADKRITFLYDYMGRRVRKQVYSGTPGSWNAVPDETRMFVYDGWNLIRETVSAGASDGDTYYVWGLDLSQSTQGAGGIGGLLCSVSGGEVRQYTYDANGNVGQLVNEDGGIVARYEYDPFGNLTAGYGEAAVGNAFRFSTKYFDGETGLVYYGFRYYSNELGRWISRDPLYTNQAFGDIIEYKEIFGLESNTYCFSENNGLNYTDYLGMYTINEALALEFPQERVLIYPDFGDSSFRAKQLRKLWLKKYNVTLKKVFEIWFEWEKRREKWWINLPPCPRNLCLNDDKASCPNNPDKEKWYDPKKPGYAELYLHPDISWSMRSKPDAMGHTNQCTYDQNGKLFLTPPQSGTVDWFRSGTWTHYYHDVEPIYLANSLDGGREMSLRATSPKILSKPGPNMLKYYEVRPLHAESE
ncbi:RHS repeat-associated core domain-containing pro tein [Desulfonema ishimotonii]|uniref:RHS repeat-associated core domain-containing pro tein n=1 Tax=Desulfonema ishimotonii TaxID=45657 RepID=A0A401G2X2_9BACT|nr:RHS repeat-associated core domain-containing protein [Desulfonema ishimotonii]GBC63574.1 RHS repeat-associated core domain-containing pro tein [Desulfonema ishimotonii]